jgi:hypothetical protein
VRTHKHQCGLGAYGFDPREGCGHIWEHAEPDGTDTEETYAARHVCPKCGNPEQRFRMGVEDRRVANVLGLVAGESLLALLAAALRRIEAEERSNERLFDRRK